MNIGWAIDPYSRESSLYLVAYLDILGTTERIKDQAHADETLNILHNLYTLNASTAKIIFKQEAGIAFRVFPITSLWLSLCRIIAGSRIG